MTLLQERLRTTKDFVTDRGADVATSGTLSDVSTTGTSFLRFTGASAINSLAGGVTGKHLLLTNANSTDISIVNDSGGTAANRILTGTGGNINLGPAASLLLAYDDAASRWRVIGGSGGGGYTSSAQITLAGGASVTGVTSGFNKIRVQGNSAAVTLSATPFGTTAPLDGTEVVLVGNSNTNTVSLTHTDSAKGFVGNGNVTLYKGSTLVVIYDASLDRWLEKSRISISIA